MEVTVHCGLWKKKHPVVIIDIDIMIKMRTPPPLCYKNVILSIKRFCLHTYKAKDDTEKDQ